MREAGGHRRARPGQPRLRSPPIRIVRAAGSRGALRAPPRTAGGACHLAAGPETARGDPRGAAGPRPGPARAAGGGCHLPAGSRREVRKYTGNKALIVLHELFIASGSSKFFFLFFLFVMASLIPDQLMENEI